MKKLVEWKKILFPYEQVVEELKVKFKSIRKQYRASSEYSPIEFVTGRVKKISSIIEKMERYDMTEDDVEEKIEDIAGIRIMCQFKDDIYSVVQIIRDMDGKDFNISYEKDYITNIKGSGYKSYHIIVKYPVQTAFGYKEVLAEIQIRTMAMNFWATIEHSLNYKFNKKIPEDIKQRLVNAAEAAYQLDLEMCSIRNEVIKSQLMFEQKSNIIRDIIDSISILNHAGKSNLAKMFQDKLELLINENNEEKLYKLLSDVDEEVHKTPAYSSDKGKDNE